MKPQLMRWQPTTCKCEVIEYKDENGNISFVTEEQAEAIHRQIFKDYPDSTKHPDKHPQKPIKVCNKHSGLGKTKALYDTMIDDCKKLKDLDV